MFQIGVIVFREIIEIALIISVLLVATNSVPNRGKWITSGLLAGVAGSVIIAIFTNNIADLFYGAGQDIFNAAILLTAVAMISYTVIWMNSRAKIATQNLKKLGEQVVTGDKSMIILLFVVFFSVLREGAEIVLFSYGSYVSGVSFSHILIGGICGLFIGSIVGAAFYFGMLKAFGKYFFTITSWMLIFLAAGMAAKAAGFLAVAGLIPEISYQLWDTSHIISDSGIVGDILNVLTGYVARPSGIQVVTYIATLTVILFSINATKVKPNKISVN